MSGNLLYGFLLKISGRIVKNASYKSIRIIWKKKIFLKKISGNILLVETYSSDFCWNFPSGLSKLLSTSPYEPFNWKIFIFKNYSPWCCSDLIGFIFGKLLKYFHQGCWNCNLRVNSKNLMKKLLIVLSSLSHIGKTFSSFSRSFSDEYVKNLIFLSSKTISWNIFSKDLCFFFILELLQKFFSLSLLSKFFSRGSLNWNLHFHKIISEEKKLFVINCVFLFNLFSNIERKVSAVLWYFSAILP